MKPSGFYLGDCMDAMREFPDKFFDLAIVDPPYGIGEDGSKNHTRGKLAIPKNYKAFAGNDEKCPDKEYFDELFRISKNQIIWGANHFISKIPFDSSCWIVWDKQNGANDFADCELAWTSFNSAVRKFSFRWAGMLQGNMKSKEDRCHPTQKPVALYTWLLQNYAHRGDKILDTHVGSASSLIACHRMGFEAWGYELDADYFKAASERLAREKATTPLFEPQEIYKQEGLSFDQ
ncbi:MAG: site-specific DNA-methyltransferase [Proteobacteria bacterium]|nr:site-specific DNA-methyltransferase [Pseudomonadota bacterium]